MPYTFTDQIAGETILANDINELQVAIELGSVGVYNVKEAAYGATGDGTTDDTVAIQAAITAAAGGVVYFPPGTYVIGGTAATSLTFPAGGNNTTLRGAGMRRSVIKAVTANANFNFFNLAGRTGITFEDLGFDGNSDADVRYGINSDADSISKFLVVRRCRFSGFTSTTASPKSRAVRAWAAFDVQVLDCEFENCREPIYLDKTNAGTIVRGCKITAPNNLMTNGITFRAGTEAHSGGLIEGNFVDNAIVDETYVNTGGVTIGADGHCIQIANQRGVRVVGNQTGANITSGIHIGGNSFEFVIDGNNLVGGGDYGAMIMCEPKITAPTDITVGTAGARRGGVISNNVLFNGVWGIHCSYAAATIITGNRVSDMNGDGISGDSERCVIANNVVSNCVKSEAPPLQLSGHQGAIRWWGDRCIFTGNHVFDNQTAKTTLHALVAGNQNHTIIGNDFRDGYVTAAINSTATAGNTNVIRNNRGFNPVGASTQTPGASPYTLTAGPTTEAVHISGGTVSSITRSGVTMPTSGTFVMEPGETIVITYSVAPTIVRDKK